MYMTVSTNSTRITDKSTRCFFLRSTWSPSANSNTCYHISTKKKRLCKDCFIMISLNRLYGAQPLDSFTGRQPRIIFRVKFL